jgi:RNA polymerase sigma-70 factor (ECF subfamily)
VGTGAHVGADLERLLVRTARGDETAFAALYDRVAAAVWGLALRIVRDPARAEEVAQDALLEVWRTAPRYDAGRGSARAYVLTITHRRAVDFVRHEQAARDRERRAPVAPEIAYDAVDETVTTRLEHEQVRRCLNTLTQLQHEAVTLAYYGGNTYAEVASLLDVNPATVKTRLRDGLIRLRDCLGVGR